MSEIYELREKQKFSENTEEIDNITSISNLNSSIINYSNSFSFNKEIKYNYPIRCPTCYMISKLIKADFKNNNFIIICNNDHKFNYNSYETFQDDISKNINNILCHECKSNLSNKELLQCNECHLFICEDCRNKHNETFNHLNYINLSNLDNKCMIFQKENFTINEINDEYKQVEEIIEIKDNIKKALNEWKNKLENIINKSFKILDNYIKTHEKIIKHFKDNFEYYNSNFDALLNYDLFHQNIYIIYDYVQTVNNNINNEYNKKDEFENISRCFIKILNNLEKTDIFSLNYQITENGLILNNKLNKKIEKMKLKDDLEEYSNVKCFCPFNKEKNMIFGFGYGKIEIFGHKIIQNLNNETFDSKLGIYCFENGVKNVCELDEDLIAISDGYESIKIIQFNENISKYKIIQTLDLDEEKGPIYSMIYLPLFSSSEKKHHFCISINNHIYIYRSNKKPKHLKELDNEEKKEEKKNNEENNNEDLLFSLFKFIDVNTLVYCLIEANEKYIVGACSKKKLIKFFDMTQNFKEVKEIKKINLTKSTNILIKIPIDDILIVGCTDGFNIIKIEKMENYKKVLCRYSVLSLEMINRNNIICCCLDKNENKIRQYNIIGDSYIFKKLSEIKLDNNNKIIKIKKINERLYFLNDKNQISYLE